jgi:hypothetical protein
MMGVLDESEELVETDMRIKDLVNMYNKDANPISGSLGEMNSF